LLLTAFSGLGSCVPPSGVVEDGVTEATGVSLSDLTPSHPPHAGHAKNPLRSKKVCYELLPNAIAPKMTRAKRTANGICVGVVVVVVVVPPVGVGPGVGPGVVEGHD